MIPDGNATVKNLAEVDTLDINLKLLAHSNGHNYLARFSAKGKPFLPSANDSYRR